MSALATIVGTLWSVIQEVGGIFYQSSIYILLGLFLAGVLHEFVPMRLVAKHLGGKGLKSVLWATMLGAPLPLCSCGVLPTAATLRRKGASKPAVVSFIVSVPETGVDSIAVSYGLMGPFMAIYRPIVAVVTAIAAGVACIFVTRQEGDSPADGMASMSGHHDHHDHSHGYDEPSFDRRGKVDKRWQARSIRIARYGFRTVLDDVAFWIVIGLTITGVLLALLPSDFFSSVLGLDSGIVPMLVMAVVGIPLYTCASMSTPVAAGLIATGLSPGAALVFLLAGPATSIASINIVSRLLGYRVLAAYLISIIVVAIAAGLLLDAMAGDAVRSATVRALDAPDGMLAEALKVLAALVFVSMAIDSFLRRSYRVGLEDMRLQRRYLGAGIRHIRRLLTGLAVTAAILLTIPFYTLRVNPEETGMILRFGEVLAPDLSPGLHFHWPWPIETARVTDTGSIRQIYVAMTTLDYLTSDENLISLTSDIQYRINDAFRFEFGGEQNNNMIRDLASRILVAELLGRPIDDIYTVERSAIQNSYRSKLQNALRSLDQGYELVDARLEHVHAPEDVHDSFRDLASAVEDRQRSIFRANGNATAMINAANGQASEVLDKATADASYTEALANARAESFLPLAKVHAEYSGITESRLRFETIDRTLDKPQKFLNTAPNSRGVDLWIDPARNDIVKFTYRE